MPIFSIFTPEFCRRFRSNRRGYISLMIFSVIFIFCLFAEIIANEKPLILLFEGKIRFPVFEKISEFEFGGELLSEADYQDPWLQKQIRKSGWIIFAPSHFSFDSINFSSEKSAPSAPNLVNWLGTDDQGRDVFARLIYGARISLFFGLVLSLCSLVIGVFLGSIQGYFGGRMDLILQRFIEIWASMPMMFLLIIFSAFIVPSFGTLLILMLLFSWIAVVGYVRAEFLRLRNFEFVLSAKALGASNWRIIFFHILPNSAPIIIANLPFLVAESIGTLTALDFLGLGLPAGSASLGELLAQGKNNLNASWLAITGFFSITLILTLLVFIGEALRDGFDSRKTAF